MILMMVCSSPPPRPSLPPCSISKNSLSSTRSCRLAVSKGFVRLLLPSISDPVYTEHHAMQCPPSFSSSSSLSLQMAISAPDSYDLPSSPVGASPVNTPSALLGDPGCVDSVSPPGFSPVAGAVVAAK